MLGPGIGGFELLVVAIVALIVVGPKDLPLMMRKVGQFLGRARRMAAEFRASFDDMARQSELDDLRREVEALRSGKTALGEDAARTLTDIDRDLSQPVMTAQPAAPATTQATPQAAAPAEPERRVAPDQPATPVKTPAKPRARRRKAAP